MFCTTIIAIDAGSPAGRGIARLLAEHEHHHRHPNMHRRPSLPCSRSTSPRHTHMAPALPGSRIKSNPRTSKIRSQAAEVRSYRNVGDSKPFQLDPRLKKQCSPRLHQTEATARRASKPGAGLLTPPTPDDNELSLIAQQQEVLYEEPPKQSPWAEQFSGALKLDNFPHGVKRVRVGLHRHLNRVHFSSSMCVLFAFFWFHSMVHLIVWAP